MTKESAANVFFGAYNAKGELAEPVNKAWSFGKGVTVPEV